MKIFYIIFFTFVFFISNGCNDHSCDFRPYSGDIRVADINGRQIYTLFTSHLNKEGEKFLDILNSDINIIESTDKFISEHPDRINSERSDFRQIKSLLTPRKIDWIGIEEVYTHIQIEQELQDYRKTKEFFSQYSNDGLWNQEKTDDLVYLLYPVWLKILAEYPDETDEIRVISLENEALHAEASTLMSLKNRALEGIIDDE